MYYFHTTSYNSSSRSNVVEQQRRALIEDANIPDTHTHTRAHAHKNALNDRIPVNHIVYIYMYKFGFRG